MLFLKISKVFFTFVCCIKSGFFLEPDPELIFFRDRLKCNRLSTMMIGFDTGRSVLKYLLMVCIPCTVFVNLFAFLLILHLILNSRALLLSNKYIGSTVFIIFGLVVF